MAVKKELTAYAIELALKEGYDERVAIEIADVLARDSA
jgi:hypothetical protein